MLNATGLYNLITEKMQDKTETTDPDTQVVTVTYNYPKTELDSRTRLSKAIGEYISANVDIIYAWAGAYTPPSGPVVNDPTVSFSPIISYNNSIMAMSTNQVSFALNLTAFIKSCVVLQKPSNLWTLGEMTFNPAGLITITMLATLTTYEQSMLSLCTQIIAQFLLTYSNVISVAGVRLPSPLSATPFTGATTLMTIL